MSGDSREHWHDDGLPAPDDAPAPLELPRADAVLGEHRQWIAVVGATDPEQERMLRFWALSAVDALGIDIDPFEIEIQAVERFPVDSNRGVNAERVMLAPEAAAVDGPGDEVRLAFRLCRLIAEMQVMRLGFVSDGFGAFLIALAGSWAAYREWVLTREMPAEHLSRVPLEHATPQDLGAMIGVALAGDVETQAAIGPWLESRDVDDDLKASVVETLATLGEPTTFAEVLDHLAQLAESLRRMHEG
jgi:hypothetical protein